MLIKNVLLIFIGLASGATVAAGVFAFITMLMIVPRLSARTGTAEHIKLYEDCIVAGGVLANIFYLFGIHLPLTVAGICAFGFFAGVYVGCLAMALAEMLKVIPIFVMRAKLTQGLPVIVLCIAVAKMLATLFQFFYINR